MPVIAAFSVSALSALAVKEDLLEPGMRAMVASLVVFLPGATLTTAVLELAAGQMVSGSSRLVSGCVQLALLSFGILAGIEAVGIPSSRVLFGREELLGAWSPWLGRARVRRRCHGGQLGAGEVVPRPSRRALRGVDRPSPRQRASSAAT